MAWCVSSVFSQTHQESAKSVVKITATLDNGKQETGTGFVWSQPDYVVTALHVVAGAKSIEVRSEALGKERNATLINVHKESDLALLKLESADLALTPLKAASTPPNFNDVHYIWGYPKDVNTMQGNDLRFALSLGGKEATMKSIFKSPDEFEAKVGAQGYPQIQAKILRVGSTLQPGHSGAPIFDKSGAVVGIGDGGLYNGIASINWAIPAHAYLAALPASKDPKPTERSKHSTLMSTYVEQPAIVKAPPRKVKTADGKVRVIKSQTLHLAWTASVADVLQLVSAEDLKALQKLSAEVSRKNSADIQKELLDVYEDYSIGATVAVPHGLALSYSAQDRMFEAWSKSKRVGLFIRFEKNKTRKAGKQAMASYERGLRKAPAQIASLMPLFGKSSGNKDSAYMWDDTPDDPEWVEEEAMPEDWEEQTDPDMTFAEDEELEGEEEPRFEEEEAEEEEPTAEEDDAEEDDPSIEEDDDDAEEEEPPADEEDAEEDEPQADEEEEDDDEPPYDFTGERGGPFVLPALFENPLAHGIAPPAASQKDFRTETFKILKDKKGGRQGEMFTSFVFEGPNFLGAGVFVHDFKAMSKEDWVTYYMMVLCSKLAAFSVE